MRRLFFVLRILLQRASHCFRSDFLGVLPSGRALGVNSRGGDAACNRAFAHVLHAILYLGDCASLHSEATLRAYVSCCG